MEHIICDTLIALLIFDFLNAIRKLRHILYCNVRVLFMTCTLSHDSYHPLINISCHMSVNRDQLAIVVVIDWQWDFRLHVQSVPITTNSMSLNLAHGKMYSIQLCMIHFVSELRHDDGLLRVLRFLQTIKLTDKI